MKRINEYKKLFEVDGAIELAPLKKKYRLLVKEWHPDKFPNGGEKALEAEEMSRRVIDGYHFLVSISPATKEANLEEFTTTTTESMIDDLQHKGLRLEITFTDGNTYEFFGVNKQLYTKLLSSDKQLRFARRKIFSSCVYRKAKSGTKED
ncbi:MAG: KTSC domain-containing protein [Bacteroidetes bacterium]|jgi:molecular chaperone HscB|nr:KTSC domain-containing protein [Bacteroidota bacterium]|tara:strand:- start:733 stop:1182 length:450 start_codon:yes stop_codon:yes gene_type:complete